MEGDGVTLLRSSIRSNVSLQGLKPLPVFCRPIVQQVGHFGRRLGITNKFVLHSACSKIRDYFCLVSQDILGRRVGSGGWTG